MRRLKKETRKRFIRKSKHDFTMERVKGLKPSTSAMARQRSNQLSYTRKVPHDFTKMNRLCNVFFFLRNDLGYQETIRDSCKSF